jgi:peptidylprolyl isomerase
VRLLPALRRPLLVAVIPAALALAACGGSSSGATPSTSTSGSTSASTSTSTSTSTSASPSPTYSIGPGPTPTVSGAFDTKPTVTLPSGTPSTNLVVKTLIQGSGAVVKKGDLLVADYSGEIWNTAGTVFDNSFDRGVPAAFQIGAGQVIPGWDSALVGVKTGSRLVLVVPPAAGYGSAGQSDAGISGTDTIVFVVDVLNTYDDSGRAKGTKTDASLVGLPAVTGGLDAQPTVKVPTTETPPVAAKAIVLYKGTGPVLKAKTLLIAQYNAVGWDNTPVASTWTQKSPAGLNIGLASSPTPFDSLEGIPLGSRVLLLIPAQTGQDPKTGAIAAVIDLIGTEQSAGAK